MSDKTTKYYDAISSGYDELYGEEQRDKFKIITKEINPEKNETLLDIGCGNGISAEFFDCKILGVDPSKELIKKAKEKHSKKTWSIGKGECITKNYSNQKFDYIICVSTAHHIKNIKNLIKDIKELSKPTTKHCFSLLKNSKRNEEMLEEIQKKFRITKKILGDKDLIVFFE
ncbi:methyltransferase domain-containing protein [Candidatus Woesearchaeota archaeon]|nr:methyltransferase domain-containing protein [Candidatus Woesearchaeota archaeon]